MPARLTEEIIRERLKEKHGDDIIYVSGLINSISKAKFYCKEGHYFEAIVCNVLKKTFKCSICNHHHIYTADEIQDILDEYYGNIKMNKTTFTGTCKHAAFKCTDCLYEWITFPSVLLKHEGSGCPNCQHKRPYTVEEIALKVIEGSNGKIHMIEDTCKNAYTPALMECNKGHQWWTAPQEIYGNHKRGCPFCAGLAPITYADAKKRIDDRFNKTLDFYEEDFKGYTKDNPFHCLICGHTFISSVHDLMYTNGCPQCLSKSLEAPVINALNSKNVEYFHNKGLKGCYYNGSSHPLRPDFRFKKYPIIIECDGATHFHPVYGKDSLEKTKEKDKFKNEYYKKKGYILLRVTAISELLSSKYITLTKLFELIEIGIDDNGNVNLEVFRPYDFNRE